MVINHFMQIMIELNKLGNDWTISSTYMFASGNPYTAPMNQYALTYLKTVGYIHVGEKNGSRLISIYLGNGKVSME